MNQYIIPLPHNDPRLLSHVSHAFSLVDLGKRLLDAAKNGDVEEVKSLMSSGAPFTTDWLGISPLHFAAMNGHLTSCEALLRAGISRDARTKVDRTPLHLAAQEGHADIVELLLRSGADLGAKDMLRMTALHWAAERGHAPVVQMLMRFGADAHVKNKFELTPLNIAQEKGHLDACDAMLNSQHDLVSSVGSMNTINGELQVTNAYILTDEKTLVPAAPPAGEVIVTATTVEEDEEKKTKQDLEAAVAAALVEELEPRLANGLDGGEPDQHHRAVDCNGHLGCLDESAGHPVMGESGRVDANGTPVIRQQNGDQEMPERDIMIVETPEGDLLYVRQHKRCPSFTNSAENPLGLAIYTSSGDRIDDPPLLAQVTEVMSRNLTGSSVDHQPYATDMPANCTQNNAADINRILDREASVHHIGSPTPAVTNCEPLPGTTAIETVPSGAQSPPTIVTPSRRSQQSPGGVAERKRLRCCPSSSKVGVNQGTESPAIADGPSTGDPYLLAKLAAFASEPPDAGSRQASFHLEVGVDASSEDVCLWCMCHGLYPRGYTEKSSFTVEFVYQDETYTLPAAYDANLGIIIIKHAAGGLLKSNCFPLTDRC